MNQTAIVRIAAMASSLRPDWPQSSIVTLLTKHLADRAYRDVAVAMAWIATDPESKTPARLLEQGPWWLAATAGASDTGQTPTAPKLDTLRCERRGGIKPEGDSEHARICARRVTADDAHRLAAAARAEIRPTTTYDTEGDE